ncbi:MAG: hypothetical protein LBH31_01510 [Burkholderiaceae bacterium]|nr:hypothetical protein [Burkholderiaceae bacterium]
MRDGRDEQGHRPNWSHQERFAHVPLELAGDENCIMAPGTFAPRQVWFE